MGLYRSPERGEGERGTLAWLRKIVYIDGGETSEKSEFPAPCSPRKKEQESPTHHGCRRWGIVAASADGKRKGRGGEATSTDPRTGHSGKREGRESLPRRAPDDLRVRAERTKKGEASEAAECYRGKIKGEGKGVRASARPRTPHPRVPAG